MDWLKNYPDVYENLVSRTQTGDKRSENLVVVVQAFYRACNEYKIIRKFKVSLDERINDFEATDINDTFVNSDALEQARLVAEAAEGLLGLSTAQGDQDTGGTVATLISGAEEKVETLRQLVGAISLIAQQILPDTSVDGGNGENWSIEKVATELQILSRALRKNSHGLDDVVEEWKAFEKSFQQNVADPVAYMHNCMLREFLKTQLASRKPWLETTAIEETTKTMQAMREQAMR